jgi:hypothetical protein
MKAKGAVAMPRRRAVLTVTVGPNAGDSITLERGSCRLIGRHLSENETAFIDRDGNRMLDASAASILEQHFKERPAVGRGGQAAGFSSETFKRGADVIFADDSVSRAHAMVFYDHAGVGIIDLASTNGTFVNSERISSAMVADDDAIAIGKSELTVRIR